jgi:hypothetical protein
MATDEGSGSVPAAFQRHAIIFDSERVRSSAVKSYVASDDTFAVHSHTSSPPEFVGSVSLGEWCSSLQPSSGSSEDSSWTPRVVAQFDHHHAASPASAAHLTPSDKHGVPSPSKLGSVYVQRLSRSKLFADGKGGIGLYFRARNSHLVVCGIIPGGKAPVHHAVYMLLRVPPPSPSHPFF